uniref:Alpha-L-fucosidase C-terminal domain-containing protein n=1 Tax=Acrobeloides nanus TaxID=290746 RepID=A0A914D9B0_9BILA
MGTFVNAHEDAIFTTKPWTWQNDTADGKIWYTSRLRNDAGLDPYRLYNNQTKDNTIIYAFVLDYPDDNIVNFYHVKPTPQTIVTLFGANGQNISMPYTQPFELNGGIQVNIGGLSVKKFPSPAAFAFKIEYAADQDHNPLEE